MTKKINEPKIKVEDGYGNGYVSVNDLIECGYKFPEYLALLPGVAQMADANEIDWILPCKYWRNYVIDATKQEVITPIFYR